MRVYDKGKIVPILKVTWDILRKTSTYVDYDKDTDVHWPDEIQIARLKAIDRALKLLNMEVEGC